MIPLSLVTSMLLATTNASGPFCLSRLVTTPRLSYLTLLPSRPLALSPERLTETIKIGRGLARHPLFSLLRLVKETSRTGLGLDHQRLWPLLLLANRIISIGRGLARCPVRHLLLLVNSRPPTISATSIDFAIEAGLEAKQSHSSYEEEHNYFAGFGLSAMGAKVATANVLYHLEE